MRIIPLKAGLNFIRGDHQLFGGGNPVGNYRVKLNKTKLMLLKNSGVGGDLNVMIFLMRRY
jgi:hypothetical protein